MYAVKAIYDGVNFKPKQPIELSIKNMMRRGFGEIADTANTRSIMEIILPTGVNYD